MFFTLDEPLCLFKAESNQLRVFDPNHKEATDKINDDAKENIINNYMNKEDINNLAETKARGFKVIINLVFVGEEPLRTN